MYSPSPLQVARAITMTAIGLRTSSILFERMTHAILRAPLSWIDTNPSGRILNRFTSDMFMVDRRLPGDLGNFLQSIFQLIVTIAASLSVSIYVILAGIVLMAFYARVASIYINLAREGTSPMRIRYHFRSTSFPSFLSSAPWAPEKLRQGS